MPNKLIKSFTLGGKPYKVSQVAHDTGNLGRSLSPLCEIQVQTVWDGRDVPLISQEQTLYHEIVHCILCDIGRNDLSDDEALVQSIAAMFHQFVKTTKYA